MSKIKGWVAAGASFLVAVLAFFLYRRWKQDHVDTLKDALTVARAEKDVAVLAERRDTLIAKADAHEVDIQEIDEKLEDNRRTIVEARIGAKDLDPDGVLAEYRRLGYIK